MLDHALGALLGAAVGDAVGAYLEFKEVHPADVEEALKLPGGGVWHLGPGQFTDDAELALCLAHGLAGNPPSAGFPAASVAREYVWWCNASDAFDIGNATRLAFGARPWRDQGAQECWARVQQNVQNPTSAASKANGATMRSAPLAIWCHQLSTDAIAACARADAALSHPNQACQDANAAYVVACASLIRQPGDGAAAMEAAEGWAAAHACKEVQSWLALARDDGAMDSYDATSAIGFVKHALCLTFYHLRRRSSFVEGLRHTLLCGGDTDTNAAIVCGLLGALHGASAIPQELVKPVLNYSFEASGRGPIRPQRLHGSQLEPLATRLYEDAVRDAQQPKQA